jgi:hypothetical protein
MKPSSRRAFSVQTVKGLPFRRSNCRVIGGLALEPEQAPSDADDTQRHAIPNEIDLSATLTCWIAKQIAKDALQWRGAWEMLVNKLLTMLCERYCT